MYILPLSLSPAIAPSQPHLDAPSDPPVFLFFVVTPTFSFPLNTGTLPCVEGPFVGVHL